MESRTGRLFVSCRCCCRHVISWAIAEIEVNIILVIVSLVMVIVPIAVFCGTVSYLIGHVFHLRFWYVFRYRWRDGSYNGGRDCSWRWSWRRCGYRRGRGRGSRVSRGIVIIIAGIMLANSSKYVRSNRRTRRDRVPRGRGIYHRNSSTDRSANRSSSKFSGSAMIKIGCWFRSSVQTRGSRWIGSRTDQPRSYDLR
ncbi:hypothetical protein F5B17DRAFT_345005 [Nemania serpens]|nr:hypothetical protein F5B17DRAFT_345005 [Nemania serpens]